MIRPLQASFTRLEGIVGRAYASTESVELVSRQVGGINPSTVVRPSEVAQIAEILRYAGDEQLAVIPCGGCTKLGIGLPPTRYDISLDLSRMNRVLSYDPRDLTLGVEPGVRIEDLLHVLAEQKQFLPLAVPFSGRATIGGIVASNSSSPLRHTYGGVRDFCLGMEFITGDGVIAKSGGRVVKNVTGYDLHKLLIGSLGTLGVITRINFRTFPLPPAQETFVASFADATAAFGFCRSVSHSPLTPQMLEVADPNASRLLFSAGAPARIEMRSWSVVICAAGQLKVVERYAHELGHMAATSGAEQFIPLDNSETRTVFSRICEFPKLILEAAPLAAIFRIGIMPTAMASLVDELATLAAGNNFDLVTLTHASGIMYAALLPKEGNAPTFDAMAQAEVFRLCDRPGINASAMLEWCPSTAKKGAGVWGPTRKDFLLMQRVKGAFDSKCVLSPGRFAGEA